MSAITPANLLLIVLFVVPGFVLYIVWSLRYPTHKIELEKRLILFVTGSVFCLLPWLPVLKDFLQTPMDKWDAPAAVVIGFSALFLTPAAFAFLGSMMMPRLHRLFGFDHPTKRGWDYFLCQHREPMFVLFHLKTGKMVGGYFGSKSFASTYPEEPEIYVECIYRVNEIGGFVEEVPGSVGAVIRGTEWERVEFLEVPPQLTPMEANNDRPAEGFGGEEPPTDGGCGGPRTEGAGGAVGPTGHVEPKTNATAAWRVGDGTAPEPKEVTEA